MEQIRCEDFDFAHAYAKARFRHTYAREFNPVTATDGDWQFVEECEETYNWYHHVRQYGGVRLSSSSSALVSKQMGVV